MWTVIAVVTLVGALMSMLFVIGLLMQWQREARAEELWEAEAKSRTDTTT